MSSPKYSFSLPPYHHNADNIRSYGKYNKEHIYYRHLRLRMFVLVHDNKDRLLRHNKKYTDYLYKLNMFHHYSSIHLYIRHLAYWNVRVLSHISHRRYLNYLNVLYLIVCYYLLIATATLTQTRNNDDISHYFWTLKNYLYSVYHRHKNLFDS